MLAVPLPHPLADERFYFAVASSLEEGVVVQDADGRIVWANDSAQRLVGLRYDQLHGLTSFDARWLAYDPGGELLPGDRHPAVRALREGRPVRGELMRIVRPDGADIWLSVTAVPLAAPESERPRGVVITFSEVTAFRQEAEQRERVAFQAAEARRLDSLGLFAVGIARDFNDLLTVILGSAELLALDLAPGSEQHRSASQLVAAARRASGLTARLLELSGRRRRDETVDFSALIHESLAAMPQQSEHRAVEEDLSHDIPAVRLDPIGARQVVTYLVANALEATAASGSAVVVRTGHVDLSPGAPELLGSCFSVPAGPYAFVEVNDAGPGLDPRSVERMFDPFYTTLPGHEGLGLAIVMAVVRAHHGAITVSSDPGHGTRIRAHFPITSRPGPSESSLDC